MITPSRRKAFTIVELLVVIAIIALLVSILLPAIGKARDQAKLTQSLSNLKNLGVAHASYAAEWNGRQFTLIDDNIGKYGPTADVGFQGYAAARNGRLHPGINFGTATNADGTSGSYIWTHEAGALPIHSCAQPLVMEPSNGFEYWGSFRIPNVRNFNVYVGNKFYDPTFYAPKDTIVLDAITNRGQDSTNCFDDPQEYCIANFTYPWGFIPAWSSYCLSPAAMFAAQVMDEDFTGSPWDLPGGFRSPAMDQAKYSALKTHMLEHQWLQSRRAECNTNIQNDIGSFYESCEPFYFNHCWESNPATLFYDSHVETVGVRKAERADGRVQAQDGVGLWKRNTALGTDGYLIDYGYDFAATSFHILTIDGIKGRDILAD